jgi:hypothetical protein
MLAAFKVNAITFKAVATFFLDPFAGSNMLFTAE